MLYEEPTLEPSERKVLDDIRELWKRLRFQLQQRPFKWRGQLARTLRARAIQGSNTIEGYVVSEEDALAAVLGAEKSADADETAWPNVLHYREAMDYVLALSGAPDFAYSKDLIRSLHFIMLRHAPHAHPGVWRQGPIFVRRAGTGEPVHEGADADKVPGLIEELAVHLTEHDSDTPTRLVRAAMAHLNLVMIHPFSDGNGRMSRCLQTLVLVRGGGADDALSSVMDPTFSSIEEYLGRNILEYYDVLAKVGGGSWDPSRDARPWVRFCLKAHLQQAWLSKRYFDRVGEVSEVVEAVLADRGVPDRAGTSLANAAMGATLRNEVYRYEADVSMTVASRDLKQLVEAKLLVAVGDKRGRHYVASDELLKLVRPARKRPALPDPFGPDTE